MIKQDFKVEEIKIVSKINLIDYIEDCEKTYSKIIVFCLIGFVILLILFGGYLI